MHKALIVVLILILGVGGFLGWDWYAKTKKQALEPGITLYYWTDAEGNKHFSDSPPPEGAKNIYEEKGYKHIKPPLVVLIKNKGVEFFKKMKKKLFSPKKTKKK
ncbi:MAG: DUF4124 domain-containing protein [Desulfobacterales bacterium]|jgi:hypothetical protein